MRCKERLFVKRTAAFLLAVLMFITLVALMPGRAEAASTTRVVVTGTYMQSDARAMLKRINRFRTGNDAWYYADDSKSEKVKLRNLKKLTYDYTLEKMAMIRAAEAALKFSHTRPNGEDCFSITFLDGMSKGGENIAAGQFSPDSVVNARMIMVIQDRGIAEICLMSTTPRWVLRQ